MPYCIGIVLALIVAFGANRVGLDRDRTFYSVVVLVVASYYVLFAVIGGSTSALLMESAAMLAFAIAAIAGFKSSTWIIIVALAAHGIFDAFHGALIANPGVPSWWPAFCLAYDLAAAACLAALWHKDRNVPGRRLMERNGKSPSRENFLRA